MGKPFVKAVEETWQFIFASLNSQLDFAVRFSAACCLKQVLYDYGNDINLFLPHQKDCVQSLNILLEESNDELQKKILDIFNSILERVGTHAISFIEGFSTTLQSIWQNAGEQDQLRCHVVVTMINVVAALKDQSHHLHAMILPMIHSSCDINNKMHVYLMVDGLELWTTVMHHASTLTPDLLAIFPLLFTTLEVGFEESKLSLQLVECYVILGGQEFAEHQHFTHLALTIDSIALDMTDAMLGVTAGVIEKCLQVAPRETTLKMGKTIVRVFRMTLKEEVYGSPATSILMLAVWINILDEEMGTEFLKQSFDDADLSVATTRFVELITLKMDSIVEVERKKAAIMSVLLAMDRLSDAAVFKKALPSVICAAIEVMHDACDVEGVDDTMIAYDGSEPQQDPDSYAHVLRCDQLLRNKLTHKYALPKFVCTYMNRWGSKFFASSQQLDAFLATDIDKLILDDLGKFMKSIKS